MTDLEGRHVVITGANTGIGRATAVALCRRGASLTLAGRSEPKTRAVIDELLRERPGADLAFLQLDLTRLASVRRAARELAASNKPIHVLVNNAGLAGQRGLTDDGFELHFGVNHLGHFVFTNLLEERLKASAPSRVVAVSSAAHYRFRGTTLDWDAFRRRTRTYSGYPEYQVSKLCNVLHLAELGRRLAGTGVTTYAVQPGVIASDIWRRVPWPLRALALKLMKSPEEGAIASLHCATAPELASESGLYYDEAGHRREPSPLARDARLAAELWSRSEQWAGTGEAAPSGAPRPA